MRINYAKLMQLIESIIIDLLNLNDDDVFNRCRKFLQFIDGRLRRNNR